MYGKGEQHVRCVGPGSWGQLRPMLHLTRGCPLILSPPISTFFFSFYHFSSLGQLRAVLHLPWGCPSPPPAQFTPPPLFWQGAKKCLGWLYPQHVDWVPPPHTQKALPSLSRLRPSSRSPCLSGKGDTILSPESEKLWNIFDVLVKAAESAAFVHYVSKHLPLLVNCKLFRFGSSLEYL